MDPWALGFFVAACISIIMFVLFWAAGRHWPTVVSLFAAIVLVLFGFLQLNAANDAEQSSLALPSSQAVR